MHFDCPNCQQRLEIENDRAGECLPCPSCDRTIRVPRAPVVIHKGGGGGGRRSSGLRLVPIPVQARHLRPGSLAERVAALKASRVSQEPTML
jgi:hypothetical protein